MGSRIEAILPMIFIVTGLGIPMFFTLKNSKPENVIKHIIKNLKEKPKEHWFHYFTRKGMDKWLNCEDFKVDDIKEIQLIDYHYENYIGKVKSKLILRDRVLYYCFDLVKNPDFRAKSRWVINDIYSIDEKTSC